MNNLKINEQAVKKIVKRNIALISTVFTLVTLSGCVKNKKPEDWPSEFTYIEQENNYFDDFYKTVIKDDVPTIVYKGSAISLANL